MMKRPPRPQFAVGRVEELGDRREDTSVVLGDAFEEKQCDGRTGARIVERAEQFRDEQVGVFRYPYHLRPIER